MQCKLYVNHCYTVACRENDNRNVSACRQSPNVSSESFRITVGALQRSRSFGKSSDCIVLTQSTLAVDKFTAAHSVPVIIQCSWSEKHLVQLDVRDILVGILICMSSFP